MISPGGQYYFTSIGRVPLLLGYQVPEAKVRIYAMIKMATANTTQNWNIDVNGAGTEIADGDLTVTTSWSVVWFDANLTGLTKGHSVYIRMGAPTINQAWYLGWVAIVPWKEHSMQHYFEGIERASDPPEPEEGKFVIWMSDGTGKGDDGDIMIASQAGGVTKYTTLFDHSSGSGW